MPDPIDISKDNFGLNTDVSDITDANSSVNDPILNPYTQGSSYDTESGLSDLQSSQYLLEDVQQQIDQLNALIDDEEHDGYLDATGKFISSLVNNTGAMLEYTIGAFDVGDWRVSEKIPGGEKLNNVFRAIDNTIGDGEDEFGNWFTRRAAYAQTMNQTLNTINRGNDSWDAFWNTSASVLGSVAGFALGGAGLGKIPSLLGNTSKAGAVLSTARNAWLLTQAGSNAIAQGVYDQVLEQQLRRQHAGIGNELDKQYQQAFSTALADGRSQEEATLIAHKMKMQTLDGFRLTHPDQFAAAQKMAGKGADIAVQTNTASFLLNITSAGLFTRTPALTRSMLSKPAVAGTTMGLLSEMGQEALEEGIIEAAAEKAGLAVGMGAESYGFSDAYRDFTSKEGLKELALNASIGAITGGGISAIGNIASYKDRKAQYDQQQEALNRWKQMTNEDIEDRMSNLAMSSREMADVARRVNKLKQEGNFTGAQALQGQILANQAEFAFKTGTTDGLLDSYTSILEDENTKGEVKDKAKEAISQIAKLEQAYNQVAKTNFKNKHDLYMNQANQILLRDHIKQLQNSSVAATEEITSSILSARKAGRISQTTADTLISTLADPDASVSDIESLNNFMELVPEIVERNSYLEGIQEAHQVLLQQSAEYNNLTSKEVQQQLTQEEQLIRDIKNGKDINSIKNKYKDRVSKKVQEDLERRQSEQEAVSRRQENVVGEEVAKEHIRKREQEAKQQEDIALERERVDTEPDTREFSTIEEEDLFGEVNEEDLFAQPEQELSMVEKAAEAMNNFGLISPSLVQRKLKIGFQKANELIKQASQQGLLNDNLEATETARGIIDDRQDEESHRGSNTYEPSDEVAQTLDNLVDSMARLEKIRGFGDADTLFDPDANLDKLNKLVSLYHQSMSLDTGTAPSFEEFISSMLNQGTDPVATRDFVTSQFNNLVSAWRNNDFATVTDREVALIRESLLNSKADILNRMMETFSSSTEQEVEEHIDQVQEEQVQKTQETSTASDEGGKPISNINTDEQGAVHDGDGAKLGLLHRKVIKKKGPNNTIEIEYADNDFYNSQYVNNDKSLLLGSLRPGTKLGVKLADDFENIPVSVRDEEGFVKQTAPFSKVYPGLTADNQTYIDEVPLVFYDLQTNEPVAFVHNISWYNDINHIDNGTNRQKAVQETRAIRKAVLSGSPTTVTITENKSGVFEPGRLPDGKKLNVSEANPDAQIGVMRNKQLHTANGIISPNQLHGDYNSLTTPSMIGNQFDIRPWSVDENGNTTYIALPTFNDQQISKEVSQSIVSALKIYCYQGRTDIDPAEQTKWNQAHQAMKAQGFDLRNIQDVDRYISQFVRLHNRRDFRNRNVTDSVALLQNEAARKSTRQSRPMMFTHSGRFVLAVPGMEKFASVNSHTKKEVLDKALSGIEKILSGQFQFKNTPIKTVFNSTKETIVANKAVIGIDENGQVNTLAEDYQSYAKNNLQTNIRSKKVQKDDGTYEYATRFNPIITVQLDSQTQVQEELSTPPPTPPSDPGLPDVDTTTTQITEEQAIARLTELTAFVGEDVHFDPIPISQTQVEGITSSLARIDGVPPGMQYHVVDYLFNQLYQSDNLTQAEEQIEDVYENSVGARYDEVKELLKHVSPDHPVVNKANVLLNRMDKLGMNFDILKEEALRKVKKYSGIKEGKEETDEDTEIEKNYSKESVEYSGKERTSFRMKKFMGQFRRMNYNQNGEIIAQTGYMGLPTYVPFDEAYNRVRAILSDTPADIDSMKRKLKEHAASAPWLLDLCHKLDTASTQTRAEFVSNMTSHALTMEFVMYESDGKGNYRLRVFDDNAFSAKRNIIGSWRNNLNTSTLIDTTPDGEYVISHEKSTDLLSTYADITKTPAKQNLRSRAIKYIGRSGEFEASDIKGIPVHTAKTFSHDGSTYQITSVGNNKFTIKKASPKSNISKVLEGDKSNATKLGAVRELQLFLSPLGIQLSTPTILELIEKGMYHNKAFRKFDTMFQPSGDTGSSNEIFGLIVGGKLTPLADPNLSIQERIRITDEIFKDSIFESLASVEAKYTEVPSVTSMRVGTKTVYGYTSPKFITDQVNKLKEKDSKQRDGLKELSYSKHSIWLNLLSEDSDQANFRTIFKPIHLSLESFRNKSRRTDRSNKKITQVSSSDQELVKLGMFQSQSSSLDHYTDINGLPIRATRMFSPTMSDKSSMMAFQTMAFNLDSRHISVGDQGQYQGISTQVIETLSSQLVMPELERMVNHTARLTETDIKNYDEGASLFMMIPELNAIQVDGFTIRQYIKALGIDASSDKVLSVFSGKINEVIQSHVQSLIEQKIDTWIDNGFVESNYTDKAFADSGKAYYEHLDSRYMKSRAANPSQQITVAAGDFVINSLISNANIHMILAGDPAIYWKSKHWKKIQKQFPTADIKSREDALDYYTTQDYIAEVKQSFDSNVGKRLALMIAPGTKLADSENNHYTQIFANDRTIISPVLEKIQALSGEEGAKGYEEIDSTDAQEITTWQEHLYVLEKLGKLSDTSIGITPEEIAEARTIFANEKPLDALSQAQMSIVKRVLQPIKPVYTNSIPDAAQDVNRIMYIKTSSFPLIPQLTEGLEIDKLRIDLEKLQDKNGQTVRMSFQTGNKVGAIKNGTPIFDANSNYVGSVEGLSGSSMTLPRDGFKIQQDVPYKSAKGEEDKISLPTQLTKTLFGNGVIAMDGFSTDKLALSDAELVKYGLAGKSKISGADLNQIYTDTFSEITNLERSKLLKQLSINPNTMTSTNSEATMTALQELLKEEALDRDYSQQDIDALKLTLNNGEVNFAIPIWASPNANRFESLLNSIVNNRLVKLKIPGYSFVAGSPAGFKTSITTPETNRSRIVYTNKWEGELKYISSHDSSKAQILIPSKFRHKGKLIDLTSDKYSTVGPDGNRILKEGAVHEDLLSTTTVRIPTSGHVSASEVEIVGFLPPESGDLIIVPPEFAPQKGLDFDVDKENIYALYHNVQDDKIVPVEQAPKSSDADHRKEVLLNRISRITSTVMSNPSQEMQSKIRKTLSIDFAKDQSNKIDEMLSSDDSVFSPMSDEYQKKKMLIGSDGKLGTGAYSLDVVGNSLFQQANAQNKALKLKQRNKEGKLENFKIKIGGKTSNGVLGNIQTLDGSRSIADVIAEAQNIAVDNEKEQVMGKVNLNSHTLDAHKCMMMLGFDKGKDSQKEDWSIPFLLLNQPIIREYVDLMNKSQSLIADFKRNPKDEIVETLKKKYGYKGNDIELTIDNMLAEIQSSNGNNAIQTSALNMFIKLTDAGQDIRTIQTTLNVDSKGLGKSFFETVEKESALERIANLQTIDNATEIIGDYVHIEEISDPQSYIDQGYIQLQNYYIKPTTVPGVIAVNAINTNNRLWSRFFPYNSNTVGTIFNQVLELSNSDSTSEMKRTDQRKNVFDNMRKYMYSAQQGYLFTKSPQQERQRLFFDDKKTGKVSLASYLKQHVGTGVSGVLDNNLLLRKNLNYNIEHNGNPSTITFNNASASPFDEDYLNSALQDLILEPAPLPDFNGQSYDTRTLAQDLINYSILEGGVQQATQFVKYVPVSYLQQTGFADSINRANSDIEMASLFNINNQLSPFTVQYFRHNPTKLPQIDIKDNFNKANIFGVDNKNIFKAKEIKLSNKWLEVNLNEDKPLTMFTIYEGRIPHIYIYNASTGNYSQVSELGARNFTEYNANSTTNYNSLVGNRFEAGLSNGSLKPTKQIESTERLAFNLQQPLSQILNEIAQTRFPSSVGAYYANLARTLLPYANDGISVVLGNQNSYEQSTRTITFAPSYMSTRTQEDQARIILHEYIHSITANEFSKYYDVQRSTDNRDINFVQKVASVPSHVSSMIRLFREVERVLGPELREARQLFYNTRTLPTEQINTLYGGVAITELMSEIMTRPDFINKLAATTYKNTNQTVLQKIVSTLQELFEAIGINIPSNSLAAQGFNKVLTFIEQEAEARQSDIDVLTLTDASTADTLLDLEIDNVLSEIDSCKI